MAIGSRLRQIRHDRDLTLEQLEVATKLSSPYLSKVERDRSLPNPETFKVIADRLSVPEDVLAELLSDLLFERDRADLEKLGFDSRVAQLAAALNRLEPDAQEAGVEAALGEVPELVPFLEDSSRTDHPAFSQETD